MKRSEIELLILYIFLEKLRYTQTGYDQIELKYHHIHI